jgi:uncharacterized protein YgbK (DUF1537 family)
MMSPAKVLVIADDLTGAADAGIPFATAGLPTTVLLSPSALAAARHATVLAADTASRDLDAVAAQQAVWSLCRSLNAQRVPTVVKKVDSLLRGQIAAELTALRELIPGALIVLAPALPDAGRTTVGGVQHVDGMSLAQTRAWAAEPMAPPSGIAGHLRPLTTASLGLEQIRGPGLADELSSATAQVLICDAETNDDLDLIVHIGRDTLRPIIWAGSSGLTRALARSMNKADPRATHPHPPVPAPDGPSSLLAVVGSAAAVAGWQAEELARAGATLVELPAAELLSAKPSELVSLAAKLTWEAISTDTVIVLTGTADPAQTTLTASRLAEVIAPAAANAGLLLLTGGATARAVLTRNCCTHLDLISEPLPGVVHSRDPRTGQQVITKAGSFGDRHTLTRALDAVRARGELT